MEDFDVLTEEDRRDMSYGLCVGALVLVGSAVGRFIRLNGLLFSSAKGLATGLRACRELAPAIERKLFSSGDRLTDAELLSALVVVRNLTGVATKADAMYLLGRARAATGARDERLCHAQPDAYTGPQEAALQLLADRI